MAKMEIIGAEAEHVGMDGLDSYRGLQKREYPPEQTRKALMVMRSVQPILAGETAVICVRPQVVAYRVGRVAIPNDIAACFDINEVRVGNRSQFVQSQSVRASYFAANVEGLAQLIAKHHRDNETIRIEITKEAEAEFGREFNFDTCQCSQDFVFYVTNISGQAMKFEAWLMGIAAF